jgi:L-2-hydroxyglutarate oxidase LhgO
MTRQQVLALEPELHCVAGLYSPSTGIIDSHALMLAYLGDAEAHGAMLALKSPLEKCEVVADGFVLQEGIHCRTLVNSAGLRAPSVAKAIQGYPASKAPGEFYAKGNYYSLNRKNPFSRLVYPVPEPGGLGVHVTLDLAGQARFGPTWNGSIASATTWTRSAPSASMRRSGATGPAARRVALAGLCRHPSEDRGPKEPAPDFEIQGPRRHGVPGWCISSASSRPASRARSPGRDGAGGIS